MLSVFVKTLLETVYETFHIFFWYGSYLVFLVMTIVCLCKLWTSGNLIGEKNQIPKDLMKRVGHASCPREGGAVSYTHLDVYKRQQMKYANKKIS